MPEVTRRLGDWLEACPDKTLTVVKSSTSEMAYGMAKWAKAKLGNPYTRRFG
ncbi:Uncharacterised protein [Staphylococcus gallinarum]|uniref:Uncharacterized protein n=1 Tax=Staphylococcus gallinarum TaxID=1293 RepID=A0A380FHY1_STAGA|nr:Uncharacterised protein [Staphylococcus gallinarum]